MIAPSNTYKIYLATTPVDFRKGMDGLTNYVLSNFDLDPLSGAFFVFRSKGRDKIKILMWDGTGLVLVYKRIEGDPPPLKWSAVMFRKTEDQNGYEETQAGRDCHEAAAG